MSNTVLSTRFRFGLLATATGVVAAMASPALASDLPAPYVSRALEAVLIPIDAAVRDAFGLGADEKGVLVLAVSPGGVADAAGIAPGDVIAKAHGRAVVEPILLDEIVYYWIQQGKFDFGFDGWHGGKAQSYSSTITLESYTTVIDVALIASWSSYSYDSFSYSDYTTEYSSEISESYASSETTIEETSTSEEFATEETTDEAATDDASGDAPAADDASGDAPAADDASGDAPAADDTSGDAPAADDASGDAPAADDTSGDAPAADDSGSSDGGGDSSSGDGE